MKFDRFFCGVTALPRRFGFAPSGARGLRPEQNCTRSITYSCPLRGGPPRWTGGPGFTRVLMNHGAESLEWCVPMGIDVRWGRNSEGEPSPAVATRAPQETPKRYEAVHNLPKPSNGEAMRWGS